MQRPPCLGLVNTSATTSPGLARQRGDCYAIRAGVATRSCTGCASAPRRCGTGTTPNRRASEKQYSSRCRLPSARVGADYTNGKHIMAPCALQVPILERPLGGSLYLSRAQGYDRSSDRLREDSMPRFGVALLIRVLALGLIPFVTAGAAVVSPVGAATAATAPPPQLDRVLQNRAFGGRPLGGRRVRHLRSR